MNKLEALKYLKKKSKEWWITHSLLLELYEDNEEVPDEFLKLICYKPKPYEPTIIPMGSVGIEMFNKALKDYME